MLVKYGFQVLRSFELQGITDVIKNVSIYWLIDLLHGTSQFTMNLDPLVLPEID